MAGYTHLDEIIDYNNLVITKVLSSPDVMKLVSNGKYAPDDDDAEKWEAHINDHGWIDESVQEAGAYVLVDMDSRVVTIEDKILNTPIVEIRVSPSLFNSPDKCE